MIVTKDNVKVGDKVVLTDEGKDKYYFFLTSRVVKRLVYGVVKEFGPNDTLRIKFVDYKGFTLHFLSVNIQHFWEPMLEFYEQ